MDPTKQLEDKLREAAATGDEETVIAILDQENINVNTQHSINGWTPLHWAAHRGFFGITAQLLRRGADKTIQNNKGQTPLQLASEPNTRQILGGEPNGDVNITKEDSSFVPGYLSNPVFPYVSTPQQKAVINNIPGQGLSSGQRDLTGFRRPNTSMRMDNDELVIKARVANSAETDFIEVELDRQRLTFDVLVSILCKELEVKRELIQKVRKLPDTIIRKDKDVERLKDLQEIELVLSNRAMSESSRNYGPSVSPKHIDVVY